MPKKYIDDFFLRRYVRAGLTLGTVGILFGVKPAAICKRCRELQIERVSNNKSLAELVFNKLDRKEQDWLMDEVMYGKNIVELYSELIKEKVKNK